MCTEVPRGCADKKDEFAGGSRGRAARAAAADSRRDACHAGRGDAQVLAQEPGFAAVLYGARAGAAAVAPRHERRRGLTGHRVAALTTHTSHA